jgi:TubC N-terminal docking domain
MHCAVTCLSDTPRSPAGLPQREQVVPRLEEYQVIEVVGTWSLPEQLHARGHQAGMRNHDIDRWSDLVDVLQPLAWRGILASQGLGVKLSLRLVIEAPIGALTSEIKNALAKHKSDLLARLARVGFQSECESRGLSRLNCRGSEPGIVHPTFGFGVDCQSQATSSVTPAVMDLADDYAWLERAAIMEFDGRLTREEAERNASLWFGERV